ncbi:hypothetical protein ACLF3G_18720 [Falsiroseomonas sp. HC035]|uniref:hypothetical protein n=1 Tax=Falsiroseomonas sp. HC035 TaxID=3390999 RepID=UPI003D316765
MLPALIFSVGFPSWPWAVASLLAGLAGLALLPGWRGAWPFRWRATLACLIGGFAWAFGSSGTHHLLHAPMDWQIRDAVLRDLATHAWPVGYVVGDATWLLRAPLHYYLPAALAGPGWAQAALYGWTAIGLALVLALLAGLARQVAPGRRGAALLVALVFVGFGGLDLLPNLWLDLTEGGGLSAYWGRGGEWWARIFQYSGHVTLLLWVPNHALAGWIPVLLLLRHGRRPEFLRAAALPLAAAAGWSPLAALGAGVLTGVATLLGGWRLLRAALLGPVNWLAAGMVVPLVLYLTAGSGEIPHWALLERHGVAVLPRLALFMALEVGLAALAVGLLLRSRLLAAGLVLLALLPLYVFGPGNEMTMRTGIAALAVLAVAAGLALAQAAPGWRRGVLAAVLVLGAAGQAMEASVLTHRPWRASRDCTLPEAAAQSVFNATDWSHYVMLWPEEGLRGVLAPLRLVPARPEAVARCWPDQAGTVPGSAAPASASSAGP